MKLRNFFKAPDNIRAVQTRPTQAHPFAGWMGYMPLSTPDHRLYQSIREGIPLIDAALDKIVRLTGGFTVACSDPAMREKLEEFVSHIPVGPHTYSLREFITIHLDSLLTYGNAVGEIVLDPKGEKIQALYNADLSVLHIKEGKTPLETVFYTKEGLDKYRRVPFPQLILFTPLQPRAGEIRGRSLLGSLPFVASILLKIFQATSNNFQRMGNLRYAVTYNPKGSPVDRIHAKEIADSMAEQWSQVMAGDEGGQIKDFVAVGDVDIKVIGSDSQIIDTQVPVRQLLEQIVAKLGIPPYMLGLHWSTTERMSIQQADILTSELASYRHLLERVIVRVCETFLRLEGSGGRVAVSWSDINLQDQMEEANVRLVNAQAASLECKLGGKNEEIATV